MQIIIPMSGYGRRFKASGYSQPKYMLEILNGQSIIEKLIATFPKDSNVLFILNSIDYGKQEIVSKLRSLSSRSSVVSIKPHSEGPVRTLLEASGYINLDQEVIVSYCDYVPAWDYCKTTANARNASADCCVATYRGYHPHHKDDGDRYGYCRTYQDTMKILDYQEKLCFTNSPQQENASCGLYYFKNGNLLLEYSKLLASTQKRVNGEMYVSMVAMEMISAGKNVIVDDIMYMLQLGTPRDYESVRYNIDIILKLLNEGQVSFKPSRGLPCILPMAGRGSRFAKHGITTPKQFLPLFNSITSVLSLANLPISEIHLGILSNHEDEVSRLFPGSSSITIIDDIMNGQALTCRAMLASACIKGPFMITPCDSALIVDSSKISSLLEDSTWDIVVITCGENPATLDSEDSYSWVLYDTENVVQNIFCKQFPNINQKQDLSCGHIDGTFVFRSTHLYNTLMRELLARGPQEHLSEYYVDDLVRIAVSNGVRVLNLAAESYVCFGTPSDYDQLCYYYNSLVSLGAITK
jgi:dTDP-glucose pyrophosphorylase